MDKDYRARLDAIAAEADAKIDGIAGRAREVLGDPGPAEPPKPPPPAASTPGWDSVEGMSAMLRDDGGKPPLDAAETLAEAVHVWTLLMTPLVLRSKTIPVGSRPQRLRNLIERERLRQTWMIYDGMPAAEADRTLDAGDWPRAPDIEDPLEPGQVGWPEELIAVIVGQYAAFMRTTLSQVPGITTARVENRVREMAGREARRLGLIHLAGLSTAAAEAAIEAEEGPLMPAALRLPPRRPVRQRIARWLLGW